jgi:hypothetical protein
MDLDVLAVQEAEDIDTLRRFARDDLKGLYKHSVLIEGNDPRLIDVGLLSKRPLGGITSWQNAADPQDLGQPVFSRDLLQVEVLRDDRTQHLFTIFVNHLKSHFVPFDVDDPAAEAKRANELRRRQCEVAAQIIDAEMRPNSAFLVVGDMNDPPDSEFLAPLAQSSRLKLVSGLSNAKENAGWPRQSSASDDRLDGTLQRERKAGRVHVDGSSLVEPSLGSEVEGGIHRTPDKARRQRQRPRPVLGRPTDLAPPQETDFRTHYRATVRTGMVDQKTQGLENRFGPLGPTRVQIPPPPLITRRLGSAPTTTPSARWPSCQSSPTL